MKDNIIINENNDSIYDNKVLLFQKLCNLQQLLKTESYLKELCKK